MAINVVKAQIEQVKQELQDVSNDSKEISEFIPTAYDYEIGMATVGLFFEKMNSSKNEIFCMSFRSLSFRLNLTDFQDPRQLTALDREIVDLERKLDEMRKAHPSAVPPPSKSIH